MCLPISDIVTTNIESGEVEAYKYGKIVVVNFQNIVLNSSVASRGATILVENLPKSISYAHGYIYGISSDESFPYALTIDKESYNISFKALSNSYTQGKLLRGSIIYMCE